MDNGGLAVDPWLQEFYYVNGKSAVSSEPVYRFEGSSIDATYSSPVSDAGALAVHPESGHLFVIDLFPSSTRLLELERQWGPYGPVYSLVNSTALPSGYFDFCDAALAWDPFRCSFAVGGECAANDGRLFEMNASGQIVDEILDTGEAGLSAVDFDPVGGRLFALTRLGPDRLLRYRRSLHSTTRDLSLSATETQELQLFAGAEHAGEIYLVLGSLSGTAPGLPVGGVVLPLVPDVYTLHTLTNPGAPPLSGSIGVLDAEGSGSAVFQLPPMVAPALLGLDVAHVFVAIDGDGTLSFASNAVRVRILE